MSALLTIAAFVSAFLFPWLYTMLLALLAGAFQPLVPFGVGVLLDALFYAPGAAVFPLYTLVGCVTSVILLLVRTKVRSSIIQ